MGALRESAAWNFNNCWTNYVLTKLPHNISSQFYVNSWLQVSRDTKSRGRGVDNSQLSILIKYTPPSIYKPSPTTCYNFSLKGEPNRVTSGQRDSLVQTTDSHLLLTAANKQICQKVNQNYPKINQIHIFLCWGNLLQRKKQNICSFVFVLIVP